MSEFIGPKLPPHLQHIKSNEESEEDADDDDCYGPALPPDLQPNQNKCVKIGPQLPPNFDLNRSYNEVTESDDEDDQESEIHKIIGPRLPSQKDLKEASLSSSNDNQSQDTSKGSKREEWMTNLPEGSSIARRLGFKSVTSFSRRSGTVDKEAPTKRPNPEEEQLSKAIEEYQKLERPKSLVQIHQENMQKNKKIKTAEKREMFVFDVEKDLKVQRIDTSRSKALISQLEGVNNRFSSGSRKFL